MIELNNSDILLDFSECSSNIEYIDFNINCRKYKKINPALKIDFKNNFDYSIRCLKKLIDLREQGINFSTPYNNNNIKFIINNYPQDVIPALKALSIDNRKKRYTFLYDVLFNSLDLLWDKQNPCKFCDDICIASRNHQSNHVENGCCYSFQYSRNPLNFIENIEVCQYLGNDKKCKTQNLSCKFFVCNYLKRNHIFDINMNEFLLIQVFFNYKQRLILKYNFFKSKEEILEKLLEENHYPTFIYYLRNMYRLL